MSPLRYTASKEEDGGGEDTWSLTIRNVSVMDSGVFECQVDATDKTRDAFSFNIFHKTIKIFTSSALFQSFPSLLGDKTYSETLTAIVPCWALLEDKSKMELFFIFSLRVLR